MKIRVIDEWKNEAEGRARVTGFTEQSAGTTAVAAAQASNPTVIRVVGVGGGGSNAVNRMIESGLDGVDFLAANTDLQALTRCMAETKLPLGYDLTGGLGAGGDPAVGEKAALEDEETIRSQLRNSDMVFITAGMGGGTGTGGAPVVAKIARELEALTVAVVTKPFKFEGFRKQQLAEEGIAKLREAVDTLIIIPNEHLLKICDKGTTVNDAFLTADDVLRQGVQGISELITKTGMINIDFADVRTTMKGQGDAIMGIGVGRGETRAVDAATDAINNPLLEDAHIEGASRVLVNITSGSDLALDEMREIIEIVTNNCDKEALIIPGNAIDSDMEDEVNVTVIATGFQRGATVEEEPDPEPEPESSTISTAEWNNMNTRGIRKMPGEYLTGRNMGDQDLGIPTYLRDRERYGSGEAE